MFKIETDRSWKENKGRIRDNCLIITQCLPVHNVWNLGRDFHVYMCRNVRKPTFWYLRHVKTQISLRIRVVWSESSLSAWRNFASLAIQNALSDHCANTQTDLNIPQAHMSGSRYFFTCWGSYIHVRSYGDWIHQVDFAPLFIWEAIFVFPFTFLHTNPLLSRPCLSRITAYLEVKIWSLFKHENLTTGNKILWKREEIATISPLFHNIFNISLISGVKLYTHLWNVVRFIVSSILQSWYVEERISRSISEGPLDFEITSRLYFIPRWTNALLF